MNPEVSSDDPRIPSRPLWAFAILSLPILGIFVLFVAYAVMWSLGLSGRAAVGEPVEHSFIGCAEARPFLEARLADMGLEGTWADTPDGYTVRYTPTGDSAVDAGIPATLARPASLEVLGDGRVLATSADIEEASVRMDIFMVSYVLLRVGSEAAERVKGFVRENPGSKMFFHVDGEQIGWQSNQNPVAIGDLEINPAISDELERMRAIAAWSVTLDHGPLPCVVSVRQ